jgi:3-hydroxybutyryl-CoA dehydrogenase
MTQLTSDTVVGVLGAGAMGSGIAQVAATAGHRVIVLDAFAPSLDKAREGMERSLARDVEKGRMAADAARDVQHRVRFASDGADLSVYSECGLIIEAIVEDLEAKKDAFRALEAVVTEGCVLATNTSSLSVGAIAGACQGPSRVVGIHFFNPATIMPLVEVVGAITSAPQVVDQAFERMQAWGKVVVRATDTPGFIVNRVARPFYGEALRIYEEGIADFATIDWAMKELGGFKMGPFELMDLIGNDVNYAVTRSVFEALHYDPRYKPSLTQRRLVEANKLGKKTGSGYYNYIDGEKPAPRTDRAFGQEIVDRILAMLINEAADAVLFQVASPADIDLAMTRGVNYPKGLLAWADEIGVDAVYRRLAALQDEYGEDRYRPSALLKRMSRDGRRFHA